MNDLQDNLAQHLTLAKLRLESLASRQALRADPVVIELGDLLDYALTYSRTLMQYLRPPLLGDEDDLVAAIRWVAEKMNRHGLNVEIEDDGLEKCLIEETLVLVYQTVQELLFNVLKHAKTPSAKISMRKNGEELEVAVFDQGARFASDAVQMTDKEGFGLFSSLKKTHLLKSSVRPATGKWRSISSISCTPMSSSWPPRCHDGWF